MSDQAGDRLARLVTGDPTATAAGVHDAAVQEVAEAIRTGSWRNEPHEAVPAPEAEDVCLDCGRYVDAPLHDEERRLTRDERGALMSGADYFAANGDYSVVFRAAEAILGDRFGDPEEDEVTHSAENDARRIIRPPRFRRMHRSPLLPRVGFWRTQRDGRIALREGPSVRSGAYLNTDRFGLLSVEWTYVLPPGGER